MDKQNLHDIKNSLSLILMHAQLLSLHAEKNLIDKDTVAGSAEVIESSVITINTALDALSS